MQIGITPQWKYITWTCTTTCTYACSYCTPVHHDGTVSGSTCGLNSDYGNLYNKTLKIPSNPMTCTKQYCTCGSDIEIYKVKK